MFNFYLSSSANAASVSKDECSAVQKGLNDTKSDFDRNWWLCDADRNGQIVKDDLYGCVGKIPGF